MSYQLDPRALTVLLAADVRRDLQTLLQQRLLAG